MGDSITFGYGLSSPGRDAFPYIVGRRLDIPVLDLGIPGADVRDALAFESARVPHDATVITIFLGTNDADRIRRGTFSKAQFERTYRSLIAEAHEAAPSARIYILTPMTAFAARYGVKTFVRSLASTNVRLIDLDRDEVLHLPASFQPDFIHPNIAGQERIAADVLAGLGRLGPTAARAARPGER
ncbi:MAG TPA: SGNH/GDSL hydrolase family protein [Candidatus Limnocylindria bacterium]|nr:SGNH/GDSL hydrolase family protein [Candidatus Limnocylindria bacterium]